VWTSSNSSLSRFCFPGSRSVAKKYESVHLSTPERVSYLPTPAIYWRNTLFLLSVPSKNINISHKLADFPVGEKTIISSEMADLTEELKV
jgi:hypothetical protein